MALGRRRLLFRGSQVAAIVVAAVVLLAVLGPEATPTDYRPEGDPRPLPEGQLASVDPDDFGGVLVGLRGTPVVVNVWASWCAPCRAEMPLLDRAATDYEGRITFLGLASKDSPSAAADFLDDVGVDYPSLFDATGEVRRDLGLRGFPTTYFFDASGTLVEAIIGGVTEQRLAAQLEDLLE